MRTPEKALTEVSPISPLGPKPLTEPLLLVSNRDDWNRRGSDGLFSDAPEQDSISPALSRRPHHDGVDVVRFDRVEDDLDGVSVMGTTGRRGTDRILLGSVAEKTVRSAPVPVVTVGRGE